MGEKRPLWLPAPISLLGFVLRQAKIRQINSSDCPSQTWPQICKVDRFNSSFPHHSSILLSTWSYVHSVKSLNSMHSGDRGSDAVVWSGLFLSCATNFCRLKASVLRLGLGPQPALTAQCLHSCWSTIIPLITFQFFRRGGVVFKLAFGKKLLYRVVFFFLVKVSYF